MTSRLDLSDFPDWTSYYWEYQHRLALEYLIPCLRDWGRWHDGVRILDVGCGDGGASCALAEAGARVVGVELEPRRIAGARETARTRELELSFHDGDITRPETLEAIGGDFDLVLFRDVLEHIPDPDRALAESRARLADSGAIVVIFPPYLSPYGGHQQILHPPRRFGIAWARLPYAHWLPEAVFRALARRADGDDDKNWQEIVRIRRAWLTLVAMEETARRQGLRRSDQRAYLMRPSFHLRYGTPVMGAGMLARVPIVRELVVTAAYQLYSLKAAQRT